MADSRQDSSPIAAGRQLRRPPGALAALEVGVRISDVLPQLVAMGSMRFQSSGRAVDARSRAH